jgi:hypothetical protein
MYCSKNGTPFGMKTNNEQRTKVKETDGKSELTVGLTDWT